VLLTRDLKKGELAGLHWYHYTPVQQLVPNTDKMMYFYPGACNFIMRVDGSRCEMPGQPNTSPTSCLPPDVMRGCFPRAINHNCHGESTEIFMKEVNMRTCATAAPTVLQDRDRDCIPEDVAHLQRKPGTKIYGVYLKALRDLPAGSEITYNYQAAPDYVWKEPHVVAGCDPNDPVTREKRILADRLA